MRIIGISDLHGYLPELPKCDIVCICGDIFPLEYQNNTIKSISWFLLDFIPWTDKLNCDKVIFIAGNHCWLFYDLFKNNHKLDWEIEELLLTSHLDSVKIKYLCDSEYIYNGIKFYGTPWIPDLANWAFYGDMNLLKERFQAIPENVDILLTHCPPQVADCGIVLQKCWNYNKDFGCYELAQQYPRIHPKYHLFGHVHSGQHKVVHYFNSNLVNVSLKDENYEVKYKPFIFSI